MGGSEVQLLWPPSVRSQNQFEPVCRGCWHLSILAISLQILPDHVEVAILENDRTVTVAVLKRCLVTTTMTCIRNISTQEIISQIRC